MIAFGPLSAKVLELNETASALLSANSEVNTMNNLYGKLDFIIKATEKRGITLEQAKTVVSNSKSDIDSSEDLLSQAKNRYEAGLYTEAVQLAIQARDSASKANNRLDTISSSITSQVQDALDKAYLAMEKEISNTKSEVKSAEETYGSDARQIVDANELVTNSKTKLSEVKTAIDKVSTAEKLEDVLTEADTAFKSLDSIQEDLNTSLEKIGSARRIRIITIAGGIAVVVAAIGGGFLYYKKKKSKSHKKEKTKEKGKHCTKCGNKLKGREKFCSSCGAKV